MDDLKNHKKLKLSRNNLIIIVLSFITAVCLMGILFRKQLINWYNSSLLDNKLHGLSCDELPNIGYTKWIFDQKKNLVSKIENINPDICEYVSVVINEPCTDKGEIIIQYPSTDCRKEIEKILEKENFNDIPYSLINI